MSTHSIFEGVHAVALSPMWRGTVGDDDSRRELPNIFYLRYQEREGGAWHRHALVYLTPAAQELFRSGRVTGFEVHTLWHNSPAQWSLPGGPSCVILAVSLVDGSIHRCAPSEFGAVRRRLLLQATAWCLVGAAGALTSWAWVSGLVVGLATHKLRSALEVPRSGFTSSGAFPRLPLLTRLFGTVSGPSSSRE